MPVEIMNSIEALRVNILHEKRIIKEAGNFLKHIKQREALEKAGYNLDQGEKRLLIETLKSLISQMIILNNSLPLISRKTSLIKDMPSNKEGFQEKENLISLRYKPVSEKQEEVQVTIRKEDRVRFLKELTLVGSSLSKLNKKKEEKEKKQEDFKKTSNYAKFANRFFSSKSDKILSKNYFPNLSRELRKSNLEHLSRTYISMAFLTSAISLAACIILFILLMFFKFSIEFPFLVFATEGIFIRFLELFWIVLVVPPAVFFFFIYYPSLEKKSVATKINQELPFAVIHMSAIAGSGLEPTSIFKIVVLGNEYPNIKKEFKKLLNLTNLYGYDIVSALTESSRITSSNKLSELFSGLATNINSGGSMTDFLDKRAETLIFEYRLEREKYTRNAETFMDIYISVVIAAPMILTLLLIMISLTGLSFGLSLNALSILMVLGIAVINVLFIMFLHLKQPEF